VFVNRADTVSPGPALVRSAASIAVSGEVVTHRMGAVVGAGEGWSDGGTGHGHDGEVPMRARRPARHDDPVATGTAQRDTQRAAAQRAPREQPDRPAGDL
jgi:hypothetical protein